MGNSVIERRSINRMKGDYVKACFWTDIRVGMGEIKPLEQPENCSILSSVSVE